MDHHEWQSQIMTCGIDPCQFLSIAKRITWISMNAVIFAVTVTYSTRCIASDNSE